ncbi:MAG: hypothetical protein M3N48_14130, partial [Verrucomicrobiota bacterium]|nr:hypothetical protein [Verrucomicrobiota bacterium]
MTVATARLIARAVILFEARSALFLGLCPAFFISHIAVLSFVVVVASPPHHPAQRQTLVMSNPVRAGKLPGQPDHMKLLDPLEIPQGDCSS